EVVDGRSDLFSLGVILYRLLTGHRPFQGNSALTVSFKVVNRNPVPATAFDAELPPELDYVIAHAVAKNPAQRYQTGMEMALDLQDLRGRIAPRSRCNARLLEMGQGDGPLARLEPRSSHFLSFVAKIAGAADSSRGSSIQSNARVAPT